MNFILSVLINSIITALVLLLMWLFILGFSIISEKMEELDRKGKNIINIVITVLAIIFFGFCITKAGMTYRIF